MKNRNMTPERVASILYSALSQRGLDLDDLDFEQVTRRPGNRRGHRVKEWFFHVNGRGRPIIVSVRIADTRPDPQYHEPPDQTQPPGAVPGRDSSSFHFDPSGLPLRDEG